MPARDAQPDDEDRLYIRPLPGESEADYQRAVEEALDDAVEAAWGVALGGVDLGGLLSRPPQQRERR